MESEANHENLELSSLDIDALETRWQEAKKKT